MGKHETGFQRIDGDLYPTPAWVVEALAEHIDLIGKTIWECAAGRGHMVEALRAAGAARVHATDVFNHGYPLDEILDFVTASPKLPFDMIVTNPPWGIGGKLAVKFIESGLRHVAGGAALALLLSADFDSATLRPRLFRDCNQFLGKVVLTKRIVWFNRTDGVREAPKENAAWYLWEPTVLRTRQPPVVLYAPNETAIRAGPQRA
jgi:predicted RNA methylase